MPKNWLAREEFLGYQRKLRECVMRSKALRQFILGMAASATLVVGVGPVSAAQSPPPQNNDRHPGCTIARQSNAAALAAASDQGQREEAIRTRQFVPCDVLDVRSTILALAGVAAGGALSYALLKNHHRRGGGRGLSQ